MHCRIQGLSTRGAVVALSLAVVLIGAAAAPASAANPDYKGFFIALDIANTQPSGFDQQYATLMEPVNLFLTRQVLENDADLTGEFKVGYSWGSLGGLAVSYWSFDNEDKVEASDGVNYVYPTVFGGGAYNNGGYTYLDPPSTYEATGQIQASTIDLDYFRAMQAGEKLTVKWIAGLRSATFEEDRTFDGIDTYAYTISQTKHIESDAFGVKVGANLDFGFTDRFSLQAGMAFSFLQGSNEAKATQTTSTPDLDQIESEDDYVRGEIRDYDVRAVWSWQHFDFWVGYGGQTWDGLVTDPINGVCCAGEKAASTSERDSIAFNKAHVGVAFKFGGE